MTGSPCLDCRQAGSDWSRPQPRRGFRARPQPHPATAHVYRWTTPTGFAEIGIVACPRHRDAIFRALTAAQGHDGDPRGGTPAGLLDSLEPLPSSQVQPHAQDQE